MRGLDISEGFFFIEKTCFGSICLLASNGLGYIPVLNISKIYRHIWGKRSPLAHISPGGKAGAPALPSLCDRPACPAWLGLARPQDISA